MKSICSHFVLPNNTRLGQRTRRKTDNPSTSNFAGNSPARKAVD